MIDPAPANKILFLYVAPDGGHRVCADAVRSALKSSYPKTTETVGIDAITYLYPILGSLVAKTYLEILRRTPQIWEFLYDNPDIEGITRELRQLFSIFNTSKLKFLLNQYSPTAFVCTQAIPCGVLAEQKRRGNCSLPLVGIVTDHEVHSYWAHPEVDLYLVANPESKKTLEARGIQPDRIHVSGIPIDPAFKIRTDRIEAKRSLGLDPLRPAILVMGGARGLGPIQEIVRQLLAIRPSPQLLLVAGTNRALENELAPYARQKNVRLFGYTQKIPFLMDASELVVTKPGGVSSSEALAKSLPMVLADPIPGQEERNARYLLQNGAALQVRDLSELKGTVKRLLSQPHQLWALSAAARKIAAPNAAQEAARQIMRLLHRANPPDLHAALGIAKIL